jgi:tetratricopeptide (TPR) repeat protein
MTGQLALAFLVAAATAAGAQARFDAEAVRMNNRGVAQMGQQTTERAAVSFAKAFQEDPRMAQAAINEGISLLYLQKLDEAKKALRAALALDENNAQTWYDLGLVQHAGNELEPALKSFQQVVKIDPQDADSYYYEGVCYQELKEYDKAIEDFKEALKINRLHASSEFAMARALQHSGQTVEAKAHFKLFQHMTSTKVSSPVGLAYGEQGRYSTVVPVSEPETGKRVMIPVKLVASSLSWETHIHDDGRGLHVGCGRLREHGPGADAGGRAGHSRLAQQGRWQL